MSKLSPSKVSDAAKRIANMITDGGATMRTITTALMISTPMAQAALEQLGAVQTKSGRWVIDNEPEQFGNSEALVTSDCVEKQEQVIPVSEINQADTSKGIPVDRPLKRLDQSVFDGLPAEYISAAIDSDSEGYAFTCHVTKLTPMASGFGIGTNVGFKSVGLGYDTTDWKNSVIERTKPVCTTCQTKTDIAPLSLTGECQGCYEDATDKAWWGSCGGTRSELPQTPPASDFAARQSVEHALVTAALREHRGATASRLSEITGLAVENVADALEELMIGLVVQPYNPLHVLAYQLKDAAK